MEDHESYQLDEVIIVCLVIVLLLTFFLINRIRLQYHFIQELETISQKDELTNLYNRRMINEMLNLHIEEAMRYDRDFSVILMDIDNFKQLNDTYGHLKGDEILQKTGKILLANLREIDTVGRWGGEEFIVLCKVNIIEATKVAEKLRIAIEDFFDQEKLIVTASFGVTQYLQHLDHKDKDKLLTRADKLLYMAKDSGKNCIIHSLFP